jgi:hypothetical protein
MGKRREVRICFNRWRKIRMTPCITLITYNFAEPTKGNRFYVPVTIVPPTSAALNFLALVDSGADDLVLPSAVLHLFASLSGSMTKTKVHTAHGSVTLTQLSGQSFQVDGVTVTADILFSGSLTLGAALCGRVPLLRCSPEIGLRKHEWLRA